MQKTLKGLLFDNDGVLVDSMPGALKAWVSWGERYNRGFELSAEYHGRRASDIVAELVSEDKFHDALDYINQLELDEAHSTTALVGTLELLASLPDGTWNIVTGANPELAIARLSAAGIVPPQALVTAADGRKGKPDPEPYLLGAQKIGIPEFRRKEICGEPGDRSKVYSVSGCGETGDARTQNASNARNSVFTG